MLYRKIDISEKLKRHRNYKIIKLTQHESIQNINRVKSIYHKELDTQLYAVVKAFYFLFSDGSKFYNEYRSLNRSERLERSDFIGQKDLGIYMYKVCTSDVRYTENTNTHIYTIPKKIEKL